MSNVVMFRGELNYVNAFYSVELMTDENLDIESRVLFELTPVESAAVNGKSRKQFVRLNAFLFLPSSMDYRESEWSIGAQNAQTK